MKYAIIILSIALAIVSYIAFKPHPPAYDPSFIERRVHVLDSTNAQLTKDIALEQGKSSKFQAKIDSLQTLKVKPVIIYVDKTKKIDSASAGTVINELSHIFANNNIK